MKTDGSQRLPMSRGLRVVFGLSIALNVLVVGAVAGSFLRHGGPPDRTGPSPAGISRLLYGELPKDERRALRQALRQAVDRRALREARIHDTLDTALRAQPFDRTETRALIDRQATVLRQAQSVMLDGWLDVVSEMSAQERAAYADRVQAAIADRRRGGSRGGSEGGSGDGARP